MDGIQKRCSHCRSVKSLDDFHVAHGRPNGTRQAWCKACKAAQMRDLRAANARQGRVRFWYPPHGEASHKAKLTADDVRLIRGLLGDMTCTEIARKFEVSRSTISAIKNGYRWTEVA